MPKTANGTKSAAAAESVPPTLTVSIDDLTFGELELYEAETGKNLFDKSVSESSRMIGMVWLFQRRTDPSFTLDDAKATKVSFLKLAGAAEAAGPLDPTPGANGNGKTASG